MAETYTGDEGDDALADGMDVMDGNEDRRDGWKAINKTRDYIVQKISALWPLSVARGGTGSTTAAGARSSLGITAANVDAIENSGAYHTKIGWNGTRLEFDVPGYVFPTQLALLSDIGGGGSYLPLAGGTVTGQINVPNSYAATSGYTIAYINGDGRISRGASSERYKKYISEVDPSSLGDIFPSLHRFQIRHGDGEWKYGYIAERLAESPDLEPFVVYNDDGQPDSIDFIALLMAQNAQLDARLKGAGL